MVEKSCDPFSTKFKSETDDERLFNYCLICQKEEEFFIQKAMGWALRERSKTNVESVIKFLNEIDAQLTEREALKWLKSRSVKI